MYDGGTTLEEAANAIHAKATISMQQYCTEKTLPFIADHGQEVVAFNHPIGVKATDEFLMTLSRISGKEIPEALARERGRLVDAIADSSAHIHGKKFAIYGDPDLCLGLAAFLLELGAEPTHVLATNGSKAWAEKMQALFDISPFGKNCHVYPGKDLWHMRSLLFTDPVDFLIGNTYGKYLERDTGTPLIRIGFPIFDRHHHHRYPVWGYQGGMNVLVTILDKIFDTIDTNTNVPAKTDYQLRHHSLRRMVTTTARRRNADIGPGGRAGSTEGRFRSCALEQAVPWTGETNDFAFGHHPGRLQRAGLRQEREQVGGRAEEGLHQADCSRAAPPAAAPSTAPRSRCSPSPTSPISSTARSPARAIPGTIAAPNPPARISGARASPPTSMKPTSCSAAKSGSTRRSGKSSRNTIRRRSSSIRPACPP